MGESLQKLWSFYMKLTPRFIPAVPVRDNSFIPTALRKKKTLSCLTGRPFALISGSDSLMQN